MNSFNRDNIPKLLQQHSFKVDPSFANEDLTCNKCRMLIRDVYQTYCGCTYCRDCICTYLSEGNQYCNGNKDKCKNKVLILEENVFRSAFLNNEVSNAKVICFNESCLYSGDLIEMENHLRSCKKQSVDCPYAVIGCFDESLTMDTIENHINNKNNEHSRLLIVWISQFKNESKTEMELLKENMNRLVEVNVREIESLKEDSETKETQIETQRKEIETFKKDSAKEIKSLKEEIKSSKEESAKEITSLKEEIKSSKEESAKEIKSLKEDSTKKEAQMETQRKEIETFKNGFAKENSTKEIIFLKEDSKKKEAQMETQRKEIETFKNGFAKEINSLKTQLEVQGKYSESLKEDSSKEIIFLKEDSKKKEAQIETRRKEIKSLKTQMETQRMDSESIKENSTNEFKSLKSEIDGISVSVHMIKASIIMSGETTFTIDRIDDRMKVAEEVILSPYFYSHKNGYKLRLQVYPGGRDDGRGTHLSLFVRICMGEFDTELPWPCKYSFQLSLANQRSGGTHNTLTRSRNTAPDNWKHCYDRPISEDNFGCGYSQFILHSDLRTVDGLRVNNQIIIKCVVTAPK